MPRSGDADPVFRAKTAFSKILDSETKRMNISPVLLDAINHTNNGLFGNIERIIEPRTSLQQFSQAAFNLLKNFLETQGNLNPDQIEQAKREFALAASRMERDAETVAQNPSLVFQKDMINQSARHYRTIADNVPELIQIYTMINVQGGFESLRPLITK